MKALEPIMESLSSEAAYRKFQESWRRAVRRHPDLTTGQKVVLLALQEYQNHETRTAWPKVETLMDDCNLGERAVRSATSKALKVGLLVKVASGQNVRESGNTANVWAFTVPETVTNGEEGCTSVQGSMGDELTDKSVRKDSVKGDSSVTVSEGSDIDDAHHGKQGCTSVQGGVHERAGQGCTSVPPNPVLNPGMNPGTISPNPTDWECVSEEDEAKTAEPIDGYWEPNEQHARALEDIEIDPVVFMAFIHAFADYYGMKSKDWNVTAGGLIKQLRDPDGKLRFNFDWFVENGEIHAKAA